MGKAITFYKTADGKCPIEDLDTVPASYFKKLVGTDIWECRAGRYRVLCFVEGNSVVVLTHGFMKKSQKTPRAEIDRAESYRKDFLNRRKNL